jgi:hypothetical protein
MSEPIAPYGNEPVQIEGEPRMSEPCKRSEHDQCSGEGVFARVVRHPIPHQDSFLQTTELHHWLCVCSCHLKQGLVI